MIAEAHCYSMGTVIEVPPSTLANREVAIAEEQTECPRSWALVGGCYGMEVIDADCLEDFYIGYRWACAGALALSSAAFWLFDSLRFAV